MPIYEFQCRSCGYVFELLLMSKEEMEDVRCAKCSSPDVGKLMSAANIASTQSKSTSPSGSTPSFTTNQCPSGSCTHINLPGHTKP